jgi:ureidoglycolate dehydrogenase (NAD+)
MAHGHPTTDPAAVSALLPMGAHKGYALAFLIDLLCGPLNGMPFGPHIPPMYGELVRTPQSGRTDDGPRSGTFRGRRGPSRRPSLTCRRRPAAKPAASADAEVLVPGDRKSRAQHFREVEGIPIVPTLLRDNSTGF